MLADLKRDIDEFERTVPDEQGWVKGESQKTAQPFLVKSPTGAVVELSKPEEFAELQANGWTKHSVSF